AHLITSLFLSAARATRAPHSFPTRRSSDLLGQSLDAVVEVVGLRGKGPREQEEPEEAKEARNPSSRVRAPGCGMQRKAQSTAMRSEEHTSELQSLRQLVCRLLLEKKK